MVEVVCFALAGLPAHSVDTENLSWIESGGGRENIRREEPKDGPGDNCTRLGKLPNTSARDGTRSSRINDGLWVCETEVECGSEADTPPRNRFPAQNRPIADRLSESESLEGSA